MSLTFSPQHLLFNGLHLDVARTLAKDSLQSLVLSPRFYSGQTRSLDEFTSRTFEAEDNSKVLGYGLEVLHRLYLSGTPHEGGYFAYGLNYHHFNVEFEKLGWARQIDAQGLETYHYRYRPFNEIINRWGATALIGMQRQLSPKPLLFDMYVGFGYTKSNISSSYDTVRYDVNAYDFGFTGMRVLGGLKFGIIL
ncbi:hypothetical protein MKJ04_20990 [Pontibacter sp. E15-1]|uniref:hypothetical protein n=1 Tax=Pontibacter sp. E15-1 TaxID=2919918 RepID=UPI001F4F222E|nr:hypothetical protein [Pontibacter sp. E15-1]MCJ8167330.1 hypothetical protein [Pontibacter sp. E15-1]